MILIFVEDSYARSIWCQNLVDGLVAELKQKRMAFRFIEEIDQMDASCPFIYVIGSSNEWVRAVLNASTDKGIYPILLCNQAFHELDMTYSTVCSDTSGSMQHLVDTLVGSGRGRIALYGVNPHSVSDKSRQEGFYAAAKKQNQEDVYINDGSLEQCFRSFRGRLSTYDAVICANDFAAISLVRKLLQETPEELERLLIVGCAETRLTEYFNRYVLSIRVNFLEYGRAAVMLLENLKRNPYLSHIVMAIRWDFSPLTSLQNLSGIRSEAKISALPTSKDVFYQDQELHNMLQLERLLNECDDVDREVLQRLLQGQSYEAIAEECFVTISTIKYRVKKMIGISQTSGRGEMLALLREFLPSGDR